MLMCFYCLHEVISLESRSGFTETSIQVTSDSPHLAITIVDGEALCLKHNTDRYNTISAALVAIDAVKKDPTVYARDDIQDALRPSMVTPGWRSVMDLVNRALPQ